MQFVPSGQSRDRQYLFLTQFNSVTCPTLTFDPNTISALTSPVKLTIVKMAVLVDPFEQDNAAKISTASN